eukprot:jgi/Hompol1/4993/HPOL_001095-RA
MNSAAIWSNASDVRGRSWMDWLAAHTSFCLPLHHYEGTVTLQDDMLIFEGQHKDGVTGPQKIEINKSDAVSVQQGFDETYTRWANRNFTFANTPLILTYKDGNSEQVCTIYVFVEIKEFPRSNQNQVWVKMLQAWMGVDGEQDGDGGLQPSMPQAGNVEISDFPQNEDEDQTNDQDQDQDEMTAAVYIRSVVAEEKNIQGASAKALQEKDTTVRAQFVVHLTDGSSRAIEYHTFDGPNKPGHIKITHGTVRFILLVKSIQFNIDKSVAYEWAKFENWLLNKSGYENTPLVANTHDQDAFVKHAIAHLQAHTQRPDFTEKASVEIPISVHAPSAKETEIFNSAKSAVQDAIARLKSQDTIHSTHVADKLPSTLSTYQVIQSAVHTVDYGFIHFAKGAEWTVHMQRAFALARLKAVTTNQPARLTSEAVYAFQQGAASRNNGVLSPSNDLDHFAVLENEFCKDFFCCGRQLRDLHELLQHFEENHVHVESDGAEADDDDDDHLPFEFETMDDMDTDMSDGDSAALTYADMQRKQNQDPTAQLPSPSSQKLSPPHTSNDSEDSLSQQQTALDRRDDRPFKCKVAGCTKEYKNPGGLKYHMQHGHCEDTGDPEMNNIIQKPFQCTVPECSKRYKNLNGLKYHIEHGHADLLG